MSYLVVTSCTGRKRFPPEPGLLSLPVTLAQPCLSLPDVARNWVEGLSKAASFPARKLYLGRTLLDALSVGSTLLRARLKIVSAGVGLIDADDHIPSYELTVSGEAGQWLASHDHSVIEWWAALNQARQCSQSPLSDLILSSQFRSILIGLPSRYLEMVAQDLDRVPAENRSNVRIFTSKLGLEVLSPSWHRNVLPYDDRLDALGSPCRGTRTDFAQRAMRHYVEHLDATDCELDEGANAVLKWLDAIGPAPVLPKRRRLEDPEIIALLRENWHAHKGQSGRLLRFLRDTELVACEQGRFRDLWLQLSASKQLSLEGV